MLIEKAESNELLEFFIEAEQANYEAKHGIACNYTPFCFVAKIDDRSEEHTSELQSR